MKNKILLPPARIGILGAGQLALYMAIEALQMGYQVSTFDPNPKSPAKRVSDFTCASFDDLEALEAFAKSCDVLTYEFENMNLEHIEALNNNYHLPQGSKILKHTAHRYEELKMAHDLGITTVPSIYVEKPSDKLTGIEDLSFPVIMKTVRFGYDGKGQEVFHNPEDVKVEVESLISEFISFDYEISVILARTQNEVQAYPLFRNVHQKGILKTSVPFYEEHPKAIEYAIKIAEAMDYTGTMAVEFFVRDGEVIFNEVAPRPHNSGHLTLSVSNKSQFKAHIEAICGLEIGPLFHHEDGLMLNLLGEDLLESRKTMHHSDIDHYEYGKDEMKPGRKMGHDVYRKEAMLKIIRELDNE